MWISHTIEKLSFRILSPFCECCLEAATRRYDYTVITDIQQGDQLRQFRHDSLGRITVSYGYNLAGQQTFMTLPNGTTISRGYDCMGQLQTKRQKQNREFCCRYLPHYHFEVLSKNQGIKRWERRHSLEPPR